jgi:hypothetical protein
MLAPPVENLLRAVRRALRREQIVDAARRAAWMSAAWMAIAVAIHLSTRTVPIDVAAGVTGGLWALLILAAASRRPPNPACALWADRHLGGASAFGTLVDLDAHPRPDANVQALRWLEQWATTRVPVALQALAERRQPARLARSLAAMLVCAALAAVVLSLPGLAPAPSATAQAADGAVDRRRPSAVDASSNVAVGEVVQALRAEQSRAAEEPRTVQRRNSAGSGSREGDDATTPGADREHGSGASASAGDAGASRLVDGTAAAGAAATSFPGTGREAGGSRDLRAGVRDSRAAPQALIVQRSESRPLRPKAERQADDERSADYRDESASPAAAAAGAALPVPAATPPPATGSLQFTASQATYVQAWLKSIGHH